MNQPRAGSADCRSNISFLDVHVIGIEGSADTRRRQAVEDIHSLGDGVDKARLVPVQGFETQLYTRLCSVFGDGPRLSLSSWISELRSSDEVRHTRPTEA